MEGSHISSNKIARLCVYVCMHSLQVHGCIHRVLYINTCMYDGMLVLQSKLNSGFLQEVSVETFGDKQSKPS